MLQPPVGRLAPTNRRWLCACETGFAVDAGADCQNRRVGDEVGGKVQYEVFADEFRAHAEDGFYNAYYDRPACLDLLGDVAGRRVLDAACVPVCTRRS